MSGSTEWCCRRSDGASYSGCFPVLSRPARCCSVAWQEKRSKNRTTPLLVVGFAGRSQPGLIDHPTRPVGGPRIVRLERIVCRPTAGSVFPSWWRSGGTAVLPNWVVPFHWDDPAGLARFARSGQAGLVLQAYVVCPS